jgi:SAM-dependent methyltransferase
MDVLSETVSAYDAHAEAFDERFERHMRAFNLAHADAFLEALSGRLVLDIGSGGGNHAAYFASKGLKPLCADPSEAMLALCRKRGLRAVRATAQDFSWTVRFHGIWANACLLHVPKAELADALARLDAHLLPGGAFACAVKEGGGERMERHERFPGARRFFSYYADEEFRARIPRRYALLRFERSATSDRTIFLKYLFRKPSA